jgi:acid phosphatase family membrane protein YuiD
VAAWIFVVLGRSAFASTASTPGQASSAVTSLSAAVTDPGLYLPYLAVAACCAVVVYYVTRPQRGVQ